MPIIEFLIGIFFIILFLYSLYKYKNRMADLFALSCLLIAIFTIGYGFELQAETYQEVEFAIIVELSGLAFIPALSILIAFEFYPKPLSILKKLIIFTIPVITFFIVLTNQYHHLYFSDLVIHHYKGNTTTTLVRGPWFYIFIPFTFLAILLSHLLFLKKWIEVSFHIKSQAFWMYLGSSSPGIAYVLYLFDIVAIPYDITTFGFAIFALCFFIAIFQYEFLNLEQIARERVFDNIREGFIVIDQRNRIIDFNKAGTLVFPWLSNKSFGKSIEMYPEGPLLTNQNSQQFTIELTRNNQKMYLGFTVTLMYKKNQPDGKIFIFQNITEQTIILEKLEEMASFDGLSNVFNRKKLIEEAEKELYRTYRSGNPLSFLMLDIDFFKYINDQFGHLAGDQVIKEIIQKCKERLRQSDIIGRFGGEEFLILLPNTNLQNALKIAEDLRVMIEKLPITFEEQTIFAKISIGVASTSSFSEPMALNELINESDKALYLAKNTGRNKVCSLNSQMETIN
ncbi:diguanylate cyclase [Bacillus sp. DNRA2]|uniref:histidine kinase N-terminal 7TM domain-containing diguanylate cyclase n=1 Tax=Bacillus sp. DNRA2 TaxID=2723053 RepID=UPI00145D0002|nr:diguanylate cyclase [Bacillus sp. DNRA2]NMD70995.1 diguanylate cyclase [Bacillus sp. DNRA2]